VRFMPHYALLYPRALYNLHPSEVKTDRRDVLFPLGKCLTFPSRLSIMVSMQTYSAPHAAPPSSPPW